MGTLSYFIPQENALRAIIIFIFGIGIKVFWDCWKINRIAKKNLAKLDETDENNICDVTYLADSLKMNKVDSKEYFEAFATARERDSYTEHLFDHLNAIYEAGHKSSRLDADLLVKNTIDKIFMGTDAIKTLISLFLILGILGTLYGLAVSIGSFSGDGFLINSDPKNTANELSKLFSNLRGAFAPSMWGVTSTIVYVSIYTYVVQEKSINRLTEKLTTITINKWLPLLYPTDFQKGEISMTKLNDAVKDANKSLQTQNAFVDKTQEMYNNLVTTNETIKELCNVSKVLKNSSEAYASSSDKLKEVKEALDSISQKVESENEYFRTYVNTQIGSIKAMQEDTLYVVKDTKTKLADSADKNIEATEGLKHMQDNIVHAVGKPLQEQLGDMASTLTSDLANISKSMDNISIVLERYHNPMDEVAKEIKHIIAQTFNKMKEENEALANVKAGLSKEQIKMFNEGTTNNIDNTLMEKKLDIIAKHLERISSQNQSSSSNVERQSRFMGYLPIIAVVLLAVSIGVQGLMVNKIANLQQTVINQSVVNDIRK